MSDDGLLEPALVAHLKADPDVAALVGDRIFPALAAQGAQEPYITYHRISTQRLYSLDGPDGYQRPRMQFDSWSQRYLDTKRVGIALRKSLNGFRGDIGAERINSVKLVNEQDDVDTMGERNLHVVRQDFMIWHEEGK